MCFTSRLSRIGVMLLALPAVPVFAQATGTINGSVLDSSMSSVPAARVTVTHMTTNQSRVISADEAGKYVIPLLPVGRYILRVDKDGFAPFLQENIVLQVNTNVQVIALLTVGSTTEQVTVSAAASMVQATATNLVQVVDQRRVVDLPLDGRNVLSLVALNAGVSDRNASFGVIQANTLGRFQYQAPVSINGSRGNGTNYLLDNADHNDNYTNVAQPYPNPDAVQEFSVQTSTFDAQYGRSVGGVVNVVTRSGTNEIHGSGFDFLRNHALNARNFFTGKDALKRNQFGAALGGPIVIPHLYDGRNRTFLFGAYQGTRIRIATPGQAVTPSDAIKNGDLSGFVQSDGTGRIKDPNSFGQYFPNNQIPVSRFDPASRRLLQFMPSSTASNFLMQYANPSQRTNDNQMLLRLDHHLTARQRLSGRYFIVDYDRPWVFIPENLYSVAPGQSGRAQSATANHVKIFSSRLVNDFSATYHRNVSRAEPPADLTTNFETLGARVRTIPRNPTMNVNISNWAGLNIGVPYYVPQTTYQLSDTISYASGKHNLRFGIDLKRYRMDFINPWQTGGTATFTGQLLSDPGRVNAGNAFGEFLLGNLATWRQHSNSFQRIWTNFAALYIQDDFRLTRNLTLNAGLRWDPKFDITEIGGRRTTFVPGRQSTRFPNALPGLVFQGDAGYENGIIPADWNNFAPRIGLAYQLSSNTVVRAAYGIFYDQYMSIFNNRSMQAEPFIDQAILTAPGNLSNPYGSGPVLDPSAREASSDFRFRPYGTWAIPSKDIVAGYLQNWNFIVERQLTTDLLVRAGYVGSRGVHLLHSPEINPALYGPGATAANYDQRRRYQPLGPIQLGQSDAWSNYNALQLTVQKRYSHGFTLLANYTWSKSIDITSYGSVEFVTTGPNPFDYNDNRGLSSFNIPHRFVMSGIWEHPKLARSNAWIKQILGGWQSNFIYTAQTGAPITVNSGVDNALTSVTANFADLTGTDWRLSGDRSKADKINQWFNRAAFKVNAIGTIGTGRRNQLQAPGLWNLDYSIFKNFPIRERLATQFRGELFNALNHGKLGLPNTTVTSPLFGRITTADSPRIVQLVLKVIF